MLNMFSDSAILTVSGRLLTKYFSGVTLWEKGLTRLLHCSLRVKRLRSLQNIVREENVQQTVHASCRMTTHLNDLNELTWSRVLKGIYFTNKIYYHEA